MRFVTEYMVMVIWYLVIDDQSDDQITDDQCTKCCAVLLSGGLDSAVLVADEATRGEVQPIYVSVGLAWEDAERAMVARLLAAPLFARPVRPLAALSVDMRDVYAATHWAVAGTPPAYHTPDEDVYLPGRNVVLLGKAGVFCASAAIERLVIGTLAHNPFPDATPEFREAMARALSLGLAHRLADRRPVCGREQSRRDPAGRSAGRAVRADAVLHEASVAGGGHPAGPASTAASAASVASGTMPFWKRASRIRPFTSPRHISPDSR